MALSDILDSVSRRNLAVLVTLFAVIAVVTVSVIATQDGNDTLDEPGVVSEGNPQDPNNSGKNSNYANLCNQNTDVYHDTIHVENCMRYYNLELCPEYTKLVKVGESGSQEKRSIFSLQFHKSREILENETDRNSFINIGLFGNMHGNEITGRELLNWFMGDLCRFAHETSLINNNMKSGRFRAKRGGFLNWFGLGSSTSAQSSSMAYKSDESRKLRQSRYKFYETLLATSVIHIIPSLNPDGFETRYNSMVRDNAYTASSYWVEGRKTDGGIDLNRNYPDVNDLIYHEQDLTRPDVGRLYNDTYFSEFLEKYFQVAESSASSSNQVFVSNSILNLNEGQLYQPNNGKDLKLPNAGGQLSTSKTLAQETKIILNYLQKNKFDYAINFHDGAKVVSYPLDKNPSGMSNYAESADDSLIVKIANSYASGHLDFTYSSVTSCVENYFNNGIVNGADWYTIGGSFQDYSYLRYGTLHFTMELNCYKFPDESDLPQLIDSNKPALIKFLKQVSTKTVTVFGQSLPNRKINFVIASSSSSSQNLDFDSINSSFWTISDINGNYRKQLEYEGSYDIFVDGVFDKSRNFVFGVNKV